MGKALLVARPLSVALASGDEVTLFGYSSDTGTEADTQASCTEAATFSNLRALVIAGGSGTNTFQFRNAGANGNEVVAFAGASAGEDTTNTDVLSAGALFNIAYTDTGTNSTMGWIAANVSLSSGHGNFHGCSGYAGQIYDVGSATRFIPLGGSMGTDGVTGEDTVEWTVRGYDSFEAFQVRVIANARLNNSVFKNRINGADGTGIVTFATLVTGLLTDTAIGDSITAGQTINASITLGAGVEDLSLSFVAATLKSSTSKSEIFCGNVTGVLRTASATEHYITIGGAIPSTLTTLTEAQARIKPGFAGVASNLRCYLSANTYASAGTLKLFQNGVAVITLTLGAGGGAALYENAADTVTFDDNDEFSLEFDEGGASGSIVIHSAGLTFSPEAGGRTTKNTRSWTHGTETGMGHRMPV